MPELPDVETERRYVEATSLHQRIDDVDVDAPRMLHGASRSKLRTRLKGTSFEGTARHGKFLLIELSAGPWLVLHFGMTGTLKYFKDGAETPKYERLAMHFANGYHLAGLWRRRLGEIGLADSPSALVRQKGLGPDAFDPGVDLAAFTRMLSARRGALKPALMDQSFIAGIGNIYSDEILFQAGIHPDAKTKGLSEEQVAALHRAMRQVLSVAIERQADPDRLPKSWLLPRRQQGAQCPRCHGPIKRIRAAGRSAYICPQCQGQ